MTERNNTNFPLYTYERLKSLKYTPSDLEMYHQWIVGEFLRGNPRIRGILAFHEMGMGKTRLGALNVRDAIATRQVVVIAPKSVFGKFADEFRAVGVDTNNVNFISLKANNMMTQVDRLPGQRIIAADDLLRKTSLDNTFLIIDEAHNFFNAIVNGSRNAVDLYDSIMSARNIRLMFLTGSPIVNDPFEMAPCFNMLEGAKLFPEDKDDFDRYFVDTAHMRVRNPGKFKNRIYGLVSYYGEWVQAVSRAHRPRRLPTEIVRVEMSEPQYAVYSSYREKERQEQRRVRTSGERFSPKKSVTSYRIRSRVASNFVGLSKNRVVDLGNPATCPKFYRALAIIKQHKNQMGMFYSNFVHSGGIMDFAAVLQRDGWTVWDTDDIALGLETKRFAIISGETDPDIRDRIQKYTHDPKNVARLQLVLVSPAGAEGIEFHNMRYVIECEPFFNAVRGDQVENRIDRYRSHDLLPVSERTVKTYYLIAVRPAKYQERIEKKDPNEVDEPTTDEYLYATSKRRKALSLQFYRLLVEASPECMIYRDKLSAARANRIHCTSCAPTDRPLWSSRIDSDIAAPDPCRRPETASVQAREIILEGQKYMYTRDPKTRNYTFYRYRRDLGGYVQLARNDPDFAALMDLAPR